jgi:hypothetical protein
MKSSLLKVLGSEIIQSKTEEVEQRIVRVERVAFGAVNTQILWKEIQKPSKFAFRLPAIFRVNHGTMPASRECHVRRSAIAPGIW